MGTPADIAYAIAGEVFEAQRKRGESIHIAMAYAQKILKENLAASRESANLANRIERAHELAIAEDAKRTARKEARELKSAARLERLERKREQANAEAEMRMARKESMARRVRDLLNMARRGNPPEAIELAESIAASHGTTLKLLRLCDTRRHVSIVRNEIVWRLHREPLFMSFPAIGMLLKRDHSSCVTAYWRFDARIASDELLAARLRKVAA